MHSFRCHSDRKRSTQVGISGKEMHDRLQKKEYIEAINRIPLKKQVSFISSRSYEILQYQQTETPVPDSLH